MSPTSKYRMICPDCGAAIFTGRPEAVVWELCPACRKHMWDLCDARMADKVNQVPRAHERSRNAEN
jgi:hypothetical protein